LGVPNRDAQPNLNGAVPLRVFLILLVCYYY
jgi:hypothetical protein